MSEQQSAPQKRPEDYHCPCCAEAEAEIARLRADHDRRVTELLEANGREVERRRMVEQECERLKNEMEAIKASALKTLALANSRVGSTS